MNDIVNVFISRLNSFIDKYYKCLLVKGLFHSVTTFVVSSIFISLLEYVFLFPSAVRLFLLILYLIINISVLVLTVVIPFLSLFNVVSRISLAEACRKIQQKNPKLKDTLINVVELMQRQPSDLVVASIEQKIKKTEICDFNKSLSYFTEKQHIYVSLLSVFTLVILIFFTPSLFTIGASNILHFSHINSDAGVVHFYLDESLLTVEEGSDLPINVRVTGKITPSSVFVSYGGNRHVMKIENDSTFSYLFKNVNNPFSFFITADENKSDNYETKVIRIPTINDYRTNIYYPKYVNKRDTSVDNQNILIVPQGTFISQLFFGSNVDTVRIVSLRDSSSVNVIGTDTFSFKTRILKDENFSVLASNSNLTRSFIDFKFICVPDAYPEISIVESDAQISHDNIVFTGSIKDDYGFNKLLLFVNGEGISDTFNIPILTNLSSQRVYYNYENPVNSDITDKSITFCFELYDNDQVNGPKKTRSQIFDHIVKSISNQTLEKEERYEELFRNLELSKQLSSEIQFDIAELRKKLLNNNLSEWEKNSMLQQINNKTSQLENILNEATKNRNAFENSSSDFNQLAEKQNLISEMLDSLVDDELKQILKEISELASEQSKQYNSLSEDLKKDFGNFEKSLDKNLELLKKIKIEESMKQLASNLDVLSEKQNNLNYSGNTDSTATDLQNQKQFFDDLHNQYNQLIEDNKSLERPFEIDDFSDQFEKIDSLFQDEKQSLNNADEQKFNQDVRENSKLIKQLSDNLNQKMDNNLADADAEDADDLRQILDNLFEISFKQEHIITDYENVNFADPLYQDRILEQSQLVENFKMVRDSLYSLSRRTVYLGNHISKAAFLIEDEMEKSCLLLQERNSSKALRSQRESLKNANDMILLLSESLKNIENNSSGSGGKTIKKRKQKPTDQKQSLSEMRNAQEQLKNQMRDLLNQMKNNSQGQNDGELVKSLIQNEIYQQMLEQMMYNSDIDSQTAKLLKEVKNLMEKTHTELSNKKLSIQTVLRQQSIVNKLLEAENAETERELDDKRESVTAKNINGNRHENLQEDITFEKNIDILKQTNLRLNSFYKSKFEDYLNSVNGMSNE